MVAQDDYRIRIAIDDEHAGGLPERLGLELSDEAAELARALEQRRLVVSRDGDEVFVYASTPGEAESARSVIQALLGDLDVSAVTGPVEHWLEDKEGGGGEPPSGAGGGSEPRAGPPPGEARGGGP